MKWVAVGDEGVMGGKYYIVMRYMRYTCAKQLNLDRQCASPYSTGKTSEKLSPSSLPES